MSGSLLLNLADLNDATLNNPDQYGFAASAAETDGVWTISPHERKLRCDEFTRFWESRADERAADAADPKGDQRRKRSLFQRRRIPESGSGPRGGTPSSPFRTVVVHNGVDGGNGDGVKILGWNAHSILLEYLNVGPGLRPSSSSPTMRPQPRWILPATPSLAFFTNFVSQQATPLPFQSLATPLTVCFAEGTTIATHPALSRSRIWPRARWSARCPASPSRSAGSAPATMIANATSSPAGSLPVQIEPGAFGPGLPARTPAPVARTCRVRRWRHGAGPASGQRQPRSTRCRCRRSPITIWNCRSTTSCSAEGLPAETYLDTGNRHALVRRETSLAQAA